MLKMKVTGMKELQKKFAKLNGELVKGMAASLIAGSFVISNAAKTDAPYLTGNLRRSIHTEVKGGYVTKPQKVNGEPQMVQSGAVERVAAMMRKGLEEAELVIGTDVIYAAAQEFLHNHPYLRPALDNNRREVAKEVGRAMRQVVSKVR